MTELSRRRAIWGTIFLLVSCTSSRPALSQTELQSRIDQLVTRQDTVALAELAWKQCSAPPTQAEQSTCLESYFTSLSSQSRVRVALGALAALVAQRPELESEAHGYAHVIGILSWQPDGDLAETFRQCTVLFQSGCYHGVIQAWMSSHPIDSVVTNQICDRIAPDPADRWLRFQCVHGLGHGLEMINNWDLPTALAGCDWLATAWDRGSCYGGAFMENAIASIPGGHHTSATALAAAANKGVNQMADMQHDAAASGHQHGPDPATISWMMRNPEDPLHPCSVLPEQYLETCYQNQGGIILSAVQSDYSRATAACDAAPATVRQHCYLSLGSNASAISGRRTPQAIALCSNGDPIFRPWCFVGVVKNFIDVTANPDDGIRFCREVPGAPERSACYQAVGEQTTILWNTDLERRGVACSRAGAGQQQCRVGAGLPPLEG